MAGHMDEVVNLIEKARRGARDYGFLLSAALLPEPMVPMLKMYVNTYRTRAGEITLHDMKKRLDSATAVVVFDVLCIPVPNLADIHLILNGMIVPGRDFIAQLDERNSRGRLKGASMDALPPGNLTLEHDNGTDTGRLR